LASSIRPSYHQGFARNAGESKYPNLWRGLVGAWVPALGVTGGILFDQSPYKRHGTLTNMDASTDWLIGKYGYTLDFDNTNEEVLIGSITLPTNFTMVANVNHHTVADFNTWISIGSDRQFTMSSAGASKKPAFYDGTINHEFGSALSVDQDYFMVVTYDGTNLEMYQDGISLGISAASLGAYTDILSLGRWDSIGDEMDGTIGLAYIYNRVLFSNEIQQLNVDPLNLFELADRPFGFVVGAPPTFVPYPNPRYSMNGGTQHMGGGN
jgi:hypothetical protein